MATSMITMVIMSMVATNIEPRTVAAMQRPIYFIGPLKARRTNGTAARMTAVRPAAGSP